MSRDFGESEHDRKSHTASEPPDGAPQAWALHEAAVVCAEWLLEEWRHGNSDMKKLIARALQATRTAALEEAATAAQEWQENWNEHQHALSVAAKRIRALKTQEVVK